MWNRFFEILFDAYGILAIGWIIFHLVMVEIRGEFTINAPLGEAPFEIGLLSSIIGLGIWRLILDVKK